MGKRADFVVSCVEQLLSENELESLCSACESVAKRSNMNESCGVILSFLAASQLVAAFVAVKFPDTVRTLLQYKVGDAPHALVLAYELLSTGYFAVEPMTHVFRQESILTHWMQFVIPPRSGGDGCEAKLDIATEEESETRRLSTVASKLLCLYLNIAYSLSNNAAQLVWSQSEWLEAATVVPDDALFENAVSILVVCAGQIDPEEDVPRDRIKKILLSFIVAGANREMHHSLPFNRLIVVWLTSFVSPDEASVVAVTDFCNEAVSTREASPDVADSDSQPKQSIVSMAQRPFLLSVLDDSAKGGAAESSADNAVGRTVSLMKEFRFLRSRSFVTAERLECLERIHSLLFNESDEKLDEAFGVDFIECFPHQLHVLCSAAADVEEVLCSSALNMLCTLLYSPPDAKLFPSPAVTTPCVQRSESISSVLLCAGIADTIEENLQDYSAEVVTAALLTLCRLTPYSVQAYMHTQLSGIPLAVESVLSHIAETEDLAARFQSDEDTRFTAILSMEWLTKCDPSLLSETFLSLISTVASQAREQQDLLRLCLECLVRLSGAHPMAASLAVNFDYLADASASAQAGDELNEVDTAIISASLAMMSNIVRCFPAAVSFEWVETLRAFAALLSADKRPVPFNCAVLESLSAALESSEDCGDYLFDDDNDDDVVSSSLLTYLQTVGGADARGVEARELGLLISTLSFIPASKRQQAASLVYDMVRCPAHFTLASSNREVVRALLRFCLAVDCDDGVWDVLAAALANFMLQAQREDGRAADGANYSESLLESLEVPSETKGTLLDHVVDAAAQCVRQPSPWCPPDSTILGAALLVADTGSVRNVLNLVEILVGLTSEQPEATASPIRHVTILNSLAILIDSEAVPWDKDDELQTGRDRLDEFVCSYCAEQERTLSSGTDCDSELRLALALLGSAMCERKLLPPDDKTTNAVLKANADYVALHWSELRRDVCNLTRSWGLDCML